MLKWLWGMGETGPTLLHHQKVASDWVCVCNETPRLVWDCGLETDSQARFSHIVRVQRTMITGGDFETKKIMKTIRLNGSVIFSLKVSRLFIIHCIQKASVSQSGAVSFTFTFICGLFNCAV
jgi:hypothetical protein